MNIQTIENLSAAELKSRKAECTEAASKCSDVSARYVQARIDAKIRDEKLAEQGKTIVLLQDALEQAKGKQAETEAAVRQLEGEVTQERQRVESVANAATEHNKQQTASHQAEAEKLKARITELETANGSLLERVARLNRCAQRHTKAVQIAAHALNESVAAQQLDDANEGD